VHDAGWAVGYADMLYFVPASDAPVCVQCVYARWSVAVSGVARLLNVYELWRSEPQCEACVLRVDTRSFVFFLFCITSSSLGVVCVLSLCASTTLLAAISACIL